MRMSRSLAVLVLTAATRTAIAQPATTGTSESENVATTTEPVADDSKPVKRTRDAKLRRIFRGPFQSSRLYTMPAADTVGPYVLSISGDGSLLQKPGILTSAGV